MKFIFLILLMGLVSCAKEVIKEVPKEEKKLETVVTIHKVVFNFKGKAKKVYLAGNFNQWKTDAANYEFQVLSNDLWQLEIPETLLVKGRNEYKIIADGEWFVDPSKPIEVHNLSGKVNVLIIP